MGNTSCCEECIHAAVCKYRDKMTELEAKGPKVDGEIASILSFTYSCRYRIQGEGYRKQ